MSLSAICSQIEASIQVKKNILSDITLLTQIKTLSLNCIKSLQSGGKIIFAGNGGSFADAQHLSAEFTSRFHLERAPLPSLALGTNNSSLTAIGNDYGYEQVFARELRSIATSEDIFIPISTSGNSKNILSAVDTALELNISTTALSGQSGGLLHGRCECLCVPSSSTANIQECHILIGHIICGIIERYLFDKTDHNGV